MIVDWSKSEICNSIRKISYAESDPRMDGFVTWGCKQDLYEILWFVEDELKKCSKYAGEEKFVNARDIEKMWDILKDDS